MWQVVRRELARLDWDAAAPPTEDFLSEWTQAVASLVAIRRVLSPVTATDPLAMLATATTGAARTSPAELTVGPSLHDLRSALADVARVLEVASGQDRERHMATLNQVAYELAHWVRVRTPNDRVKAWLLAGETALDSAIHAPADRSATSVGLCSLAERARSCAARPGCVDPATKRLGNVRSSGRTLHVRCTRNEKAAPTSVYLLVRAAFAGWAVLGSNKRSVKGSGSGAIRPLVRSAGSYVSGDEVDCRRATNSGVGLDSGCCYCSPRWRHRCVRCSGGCSGDCARWLA
jgi:hypothetical protein